MSILFVDSADQVNIADSTDFDDTTQLAVSIWFNQAALTANKALCSKWAQASQAAWAIQTDGSNAGDLEFWATATVGGAGADRLDSITFDNSGGLFSANTWNHVLFAYDGTQGTDAGKIRCWLNGSETTNTYTGTIPTSLPNASSAMTIADMTSGLDRNWNGSLTELAIWKGTVITAAEIALLCDSRVKRIPLQVQAANLVGFWPMDDGAAGTSASGDSVFDLSGNAHTGTGAGGASVVWEAEEVLSYPSGIITPSAIDAPGVGIASQRLLVGHGA